MLGYKALIIILIVLILIGILGFFQIGPFNPENQDLALAILNDVHVHKTFQS